MSLGVSLGVSEVMGGSRKCTDILRCQESVSLYAKLAPAVCTANRMVGCRRGPSEHALHLPLGCSYIIVPPLHLLQQLLAQSDESALTSPTRRAGRKPAESEETERPLPAPGRLPGDLR